MFSVLGHVHHRRRRGWRCLGWPRVSTSIVPCPRGRQNSASPQRADQQADKEARARVLLSPTAAGLTRSCRSSIHDSKRDEKLCNLAISCFLSSLCQLDNCLTPDVHSVWRMDEKGAGCRGATAFHFPSGPSLQSPPCTDRCPAASEHQKETADAPLSSLSERRPRQERNPEFNFYNNR